MCLRGVYRSPKYPKQIIFIIHRNLFITSITFLRYPNHAVLPSCQSLQYRFPHGPLPHVPPKHPDKSSPSHPNCSAIQNQPLYQPTPVAIPVQKRRRYFQKVVSKRFSPFTVKSSSFLESFRKCPFPLPGAALQISCLSSPVYRLSSRGKALALRNCCIGV